MSKQQVAINPDIHVTLSEGDEVIVERITAKGSSVRVLLKADEWQEIADWVKTIKLLSNGHSCC